MFTGAHLEGGQDLTLISVHELCVLRWTPKAVLPFQGKAARPPTMGLDQDDEGEGGSGRSQQPLQKSCNLDTT